MKRKLIPLLGLVLALFSLAQAGHALTLADIRTAIRRNIRDTASSATLQRYSDSVLTSLVNEGQRDVVNNTWAISSVQTIPLVAGVGSYSLAANEIGIWRVTREGGSLPEVDFSQMDADRNNASWATNTSTGPLYFYRDFSSPGTIKLFPIASSGFTGTLLVYYYASATDLASDSDVPFNGITQLLQYNDLLIFYASDRILAIESMLDRAAFYRQRYSDGLNRMNENLGMKPQKIPSVPQKVNKP